MAHPALKLAIRAASRLDGVLAPLSTRVVRPAAPPDPDSVRNILLWSMNALGDVVRATPAIRAIREQYPAARTVMVATSRAAPILRGNPDIDVLHQIDRPYRLGDHRRVVRRLRGVEWDLGVLLEVNPDWTRLLGWWMRHLGVPHWLCFDFGAGVPVGGRGVPLGDSGSWIDQFNRLALGAGAETVDRRMRVVVSDDERAWARSFLPTTGVDPDRPYFVMHPGGNFRSVSRQWPPEAFAELIDRMAERWEAPVILTGVEAERETIDAVRDHASTPVVDLCGRVNMRELAAVLDGSAVCIMNDTGPLHIAHALGRRTVAILGPTGPDVVGVPQTTEVVRKDLPCSPCAHYLGWTACTNPHRWECLVTITPDEVLDAVARQVDPAGLTPLRHHGAPLKRIG